MPRVPPVTTATRAMMPSSLLLLSRRRLGRAQPSFKLAADHAAEHGEAGRGIVEAGEVGEALAAGGDERVAAAQGELLERLEAIRREAGGDQGDAGHAAPGQRGEGGVGGGREPLGAAEARLEGDGERAAGRFGEQARGLLAVAM